MKRIWDKVNDEWVYESEEEEPVCCGHRSAQTADDKNLVLLISSINNQAKEQ